MFQTNNYSSSGGYFCTISIQYFTMNLWGKMVKYCKLLVQKKNLLMMNNSLFKTRRGKSK